MAKLNATTVHFTIPQWLLKQYGVNLKLSHTCGDVQWITLTRHINSPPDAGRDIPVSTAPCFTLVLTHRAALAPSVSARLHSQNVSQTVAMAATASQMLRLAISWLAGWVASCAWSPRQHSHGTERRRESAVSQVPLKACHCPSPRYITCPCQDRLSEVSLYFHLPLYDASISRQRFTPAPNRFRFHPQSPTCMWHRQQKKEEKKSVGYFKC